MGADSISFVIKKDASTKEILEAFKNQRENDKAENGHREGYSGDFQTVDRVDLSHLSKVFSSRSEAFDYALEHAEKWTSVVAVKYQVTGPIAKTKRLENLEKRLSDLVFNVKPKSSQKISENMRKKSFRTCKNCKSRVNLSSFHGTDCPVCRADLLTKTELKPFTKIEKLETELRQKIDVEKSKLKAKALKKAKGELHTLVAGWGAC